MNKNFTPLSLCNSVYRLCFLNIFATNRSVLNLHRQSFKTDNRKAIYNSYRSNRCLFFHNRDLFIACYLYETSVHYSKIYLQNICVIFCLILHNILICIIFCLINYLNINKTHAAFVTKYLKSQA